MTQTFTPFDQTTTESFPASTELQTSIIYMTSIITSYISVTLPASTVIQTSVQLETETDDFYFTSYETDTTTQVSTALTTSIQIQTETDDFYFTDTLTAPTITETYVPSTTSSTTTSASASPTGCGYAEQAVCPDDSGQTRIASDGTYWYIDCSQVIEESSTSLTSVTVSAVGAIGECLEDCVAWNADPSNTVQCQYGQ